MEFEPLMKDGEGLGGILSQIISPRLRLTRHIREVKHNVYGKRQTVGSCVS